MNARVLLLGGSGMLGHQLLRVLSERMDVVATFRNFGGLDRCRALFALPESRVRTGVDAFDFPSIKKLLRDLRPDVVVNCIGIIKQSEASREAVPSIQINALLPHQLAEACGEMNARLIHFSTDCVFSGRRGNYNESDIPDPTDLYGRGKCLGEVLEDGCLTLRTSIIGWELDYKRSLLGWFASQRGGRIRGFTRAIYSGLPTSIIASLVADLIEKMPKLSGLYHVASDPITKFDLLIGLRDALNWEIEIQPEAEFACDRSLDGSCFTRVTGWTAPSWASMIVDLAAQRQIYESRSAA